jgi:hypothetical protein
MMGLLSTRLQARELRNRWKIPTMSGIMHLIGEFSLG